MILNNVTGTRHREKAVRAIEHYCGIPVVGGVIPRTEEMELAMRHLGLVPPYREGQEHGGEFLTRIETVKRMIADHVDLDGLLALAREGEPPAEESSVYAAVEPDVRIGVALDEAFNFYYADLFDILSSCGGAEAVPFSPVHDRLPEADGYILGGGYPELFGAELEANTAMREGGLREVSRNGTPIYAECGGG